MAAANRWGYCIPHTWTRNERTGTREQRRKRATCDKESGRWLDTLTKAEVGIDEAVCLVHIGDREADIYDLFVQPRASYSQLLIRAEHNRKVQHELGYLMAAIEQAPGLGEQTIDIERNPQRPARRVTLAVRGMQLTIEVPRHHKAPKQCQPVTLSVLLVAESSASSEGKPIRWLLLTTLAMDNFEAVWQGVRWYSLRWMIVGEAFPKGTISLHPQERLSH